MSWMHLPRSSIILLPSWNNSGDSLYANLAIEEGHSATLRFNWSKDRSMLLEDVGWKIGLCFRLSLSSRMFWLSLFRIYYHHFEKRWNKLAYESDRLDIESKERNSVPCGMTFFWLARFYLCWTFSWQQKVFQGSFRVVFLWLHKRSRGRVRLVEVHQIFYRSYSLFWIN